MRPTGAERERASRAEAERLITDYLEGRLRDEDALEDAIAATLTARDQTARAEEREACAQLAAQWQGPWQGPWWIWMKESTEPAPRRLQVPVDGGFAIAQLIRARGAVPSPADTIRVHVEKTS